MKFQSRSRSAYSSSRPSSSLARSSAIRSVKSPTGIGLCITSAVERVGEGRGGEERGGEGRGGEGRGGKDRGEEGRGGEGRRR